MSTLSQIQANRRNSQLSTGPRTPEGKAVSRFNALKSGINAKAQVIPGEDPAELEAMTQGYHHDWAPTTYLERFLVDSLIRSDWLLQRLSRLEAETWAHEIEKARKSVFSKLDENAPIGEIYGRTSDRFTRLQRRIDSTERSYYRALTQLQRLRRGAEPAPEFLPTEAPAFEPLPEAPPASNLQLPAPDPPSAGLASFYRLAEPPLPPALFPSSRSNRPAIGGRPDALVATAHSFPSSRMR